MTRSVLLECTLPGDQTLRIVQGDLTEEQVDAIVNPANERLAQAHLRWAKEHLRTGRRDRAMWDLDLALSMNPDIQEAVRLKERLTQKAYWADEPRVSASRYIIQRMIMHELGKPVGDVILPDKPQNAEGLDAETKKALGIQPQFLRPLPGENLRPAPTKPGPAKPDPKPADGKPKGS